MRLMVLAMLLAALPSMAAELTLDGQVRHPASWSAASLQELPAAIVERSFLSSHGREKGLFKGVPLWTLIEKAGLADDTGKHPELRHVALITGSDGYWVAVAIGEIAPDFEGKQVLVAYERDGKPEALRLVVPGDKHGARDVHDIARIEIR